MARFEEGTRDGPSPSKARKMLKDKKVRGKRLTKKQKRLFGAIIGRSRKGK